MDQQILNILMFGFWHVAYGFVTALLCILWTLFGCLLIYCDPFDLVHENASAKLLEDAERVYHSSITGISPMSEQTYRSIVERQRSSLPNFWLCGISLFLWLVVLTQGALATLTSESSDGFATKMVFGAAGVFCLGVLLLQPLFIFFDR